MMSGIQILLLLSLYCRNVVQSSSLLEVKLKMFTDSNLKLYPSNGDDSVVWTTSNRQTSLIEETRSHLEQLFQVIENNLLDSKAGISKLFGNENKNDAEYSEQDCCQSSIFDGNLSQTEMTNKKVACQRTFSVDENSDRPMCNSNIQMSKEFVHSWKNKDIWQEKVDQQWYISLHDNCVRAFIYPAKRDSSICPDPAGLHNTKKEAIASVMIPHKRHWAFVFDTETFSLNNTATLFMPMAAKWAFSAAQFSGPLDTFTISGWPENKSEAEKTVHCESRERMLQFFSTHSLPGHVKKLFSENGTQKFSSMSEQMERAMNSFDNLGNETEKVLIVFSPMKPVNFKTQYERILKMKPRFKNVSLVVFRMGNIILQSSTIVDYFWTTSNQTSWKDLDPLLRSKSIQFVTPISGAETLSISQLFPRSSTYFLDKKQTKITYSYPKMDKMSLKMSISASVKNPKTGMLDGVIGVDLKLESILNDLKYHIDENKTIFIVDRKGSVIFHRMSMYKREEGFVPITIVEKPLFYFFADVVKSDPGRFFENILINSKAKELEIIYEKKIYQYSCSQLARSPFVACTVLIGSNNVNDITLESALKSVDLNRTAYFSPVRPSVIYHDAVDHQDKDETCKYFNTLSLPLMNKIGLFVSKRALFVYTHKLSSLMGDRDRFEQFFLHLHDIKSIIHYPQTEPLFKNHSIVSLRYLLFRALQWSSDKDIMNASFIRRYAATSDGFMIVQPAVKLDKNMDVNQLNWFRKAAEGGPYQHFSSPWLDSYEAGYVVSVSWKVPVSDTDFVVLGFDVTVESLYAHTLYNTQKNPEKLECNPEAGKDCFLFNEDGYIVAYSQMWNSSLDSNAKQGLPGWKWRDINMFSVAYRESDFFEFLTGKSDFYSKHECYDYSQGHFRFSQKFNLESKVSFVKPNNANGTMFSVRRVENTNLFLGVRGIVDQRDPKSILFCFCPRTQNERCYARRPFDNRCWCPCVYLDNADDNCKSFEPHSAQAWSACEPQPETLKMGEIGSLQEVRDCIGFTCSALTEQSKCDQNRECRWCEYEQVVFRSNSSRTIFQMENNRCEQLDNCYMRVRGFSPYEKARYFRGNDAQHYSHQGGGSSTTTPIGPVAGGVLASSIVIALAVFLIRHERQRRQMIAMYNANYTSDVNVQMAPHEIDDYSLEQEEDDIGYMNPMLHPLPIIAIRNDRRHHHPRSYATDSDHGYSTMSPHEDSEPNPGAYSDATSVDRSVIEHNSPTDEESERSSTCTGVSASTIAKAKKRIQQQRQLHGTGTLANLASKSNNLLTEASTSSPMKSDKMQAVSEPSVTDIGSGSEIEAEVHTVPTATVALAFC